MWGPGQTGVPPAEGNVQTAKKVCETWGGGGEQAGFCYPHLFITDSLSWLFMA